MTSPDHHTEGKPTRTAYDVALGAAIGLGVAAVTLLVTVVAEPDRIVFAATLCTWAWTLVVLPFAILLPFLGDTARERRIGVGLAIAIIPLLLSSLWSFMYLVFGN